MITLNSEANDNPILSDVASDYLPLKKEHPFLNSLVIRSLISLILACLITFQQDPEVILLIEDAGIMVVLLIEFISVLLVVSLLEALVLTVFSAIGWCVDRILQVTHMKRRTLLFGFIIAGLSCSMVLAFIAISKPPTFGAFVAVSISAIIAGIIAVICALKLWLFKHHVQNR